VCDAAREALIKLAPLAQNEAVKEVLTGRQYVSHSSRSSPDCITHLAMFFSVVSLNGKRTLQYGEFIDDCSKVFIEAYPDRINYIAMTCVEHFKSPWDEIKANAALIVGITLGNIDVAARRDYHLNPMLISREFFWFFYFFL